MRFLFSLLLSYLFIAAPLYAGAGCRGKTPVNYTPIASRYQSGVLFKIGKCGEPPSFILGTVHSDDPEILQIAAQAMPMLNHAKAAAFEYVEPENAAALTQRYLFLDETKSQTLPQLIGQEEFNYLAPKLEKLAHIAREDAMFLKPWAAAVILQYPPNVGDGVVLDMRLQNEAELRNIPRYGLETMEKQFQIFDTLPQEMQIEMLRDTLEDDTIDEMNQQLLSLYKAGDLTRIYQLSEESFAKIKTRDLAAILKTRILTQRNHQMVRKLREPLKQGGQFIAVGALHLMGKDGLLHLLERKGFLVQVIPSQ